VARLGDGKPSLALTAHSDTVEAAQRSAWVADPLRLSLRDGHAYGLGACNCKGPMAVQLWLGREIARLGGPRRGEVVFAFVGDEESLGPDGLAYLRETRAVTPDWLIVGGPTANRLVLEERGVMWLRLTARGKAAHAGSPQEGDSAILRMHRLISAIARDLAPRIAARQSEGGHGATLNIGKIRGGENTNVVPDSCQIEIDRRLLVEESVEQAYAEIERCVAESGEPEGSTALDLLAGTPGYRVPDGGAAVQAFRDAILACTGRPAKRLMAVGASDGRYFACDRVEILGFGPGDGSNSHCPNEHVALEEMVDAALVQLDAARRLLGF
jgi:acetylornithine deacetylase/succinyl-diaminopimelate desuccinylase-like protein